MTCTAFTESPEGDRPRLSIVIATYRAAATLDSCIDSILGQSFRDWELLIADGASDDGTVDILHRHDADIAWWTSEPDDGIYDAWNRALEHAVGEYVCFIGADDAWAHEHALQTIFDAIGSETFDLVTSRGRVIDRSNGKSFTAGGPMDFRRLGPRMPVCHPGLLHRRELFEIHGKFDTHFRITGDLDFLLRIPTSARTLHVDNVTIEIDNAGVSRGQVLERLREQREVLSASLRFGPTKAYLAWLDKLWRLPLARLFNLPH